MTFKEELLAFQGEPRKRKKNPKDVEFGLKITSAMNAELLVYAAKFKTTRSNLIEAAIDTYLTALAHQMGEEILSERESELVPGVSSSGD